MNQGPRCFHNFLPEIVISYIRGLGNLGSGSGFGFGKLCPPLGLARLLGVVGGGLGQSSSYPTTLLTFLLLKLAN